MQVARQGRFAVVGDRRRLVGIVRAGLRMQHHVGHDAAGLDRLAAGGVVPRRGQLDRVAVVQRQHGLHRALAEGAAADDARALVVAQRAGQHFRGAGRTGIHQHHHRRAVEQVAGGGVELGIADRDAPAGADDGALVEHVVGHLHRRGQQAARIAAQVQHQAAQLAAGLRLQLLQLLVEIGAGVGLEGADADIAVARFEHAAAHAGHADGLPGQGHVERLGDLVAGDGQYDLAARLAAQRLHRLDRADRLAVDGDDDVARAQAGARGRRVVDRRDHLERVVRQLQQLHADAVVGAAGLLVEGFGVFLAEIRAVRIQVQQQAADGGLHQLLVVDRIDVGFLHCVVDRHVAADLVQRHLGTGRFGGIRIVGAGRRGRGRLRLGALRHRRQRRQSEQQGCGQDYAHEALRLGKTRTVHGAVVRIMREAELNSR
ncbi:hypothetical protein NB717_003914 [Xanthomonas sacchari]|nr:hypothetical protein [Xanthomonas sacchari]